MRIYKVLGLFYKSLYQQKFKPFELMILETKISFYINPAVGCFSGVKKGNGKTVRMLVYARIYL